MAQNNGKKSSKATAPVQKEFKNPVKTWWGKLIIFLIIFGMVGVIIVSWILSLQNLF